MNRYDQHQNNQKPGPQMSNNRVVSFGFDQGINPNLRNHEDAKKQLSCSESNEQNTQN